MCFKPSQLALALSAAISSHCVLAASSLDMVVVMDESSSMSGEHNAFIGTYVSNLDNMLNDQNITLNQYGLVGYGSSASYTSASQANSEEGYATYRNFYLNTSAGAVWGTADEFNSVTPELTTTGSTEDGYRGIDYALENYNFRSTAGSSIMLITDEDRDSDTVNLGASEFAAGLTDYDYATIQAELSQNNTVLHVVVSQNFTDKNGNAAIAITGSDPDTGYAYVQDANGAIVKVQGYVRGYGSGSTDADYTEMALASGGIVMDIDGLRSVYTDLTALSALSSELAALVADISASQSTVIGVNCDAASGGVLQICSALQASSNAQLKSLVNDLTEVEDYSKFSQYQVGQVLRTAVSNRLDMHSQISHRLEATRTAGYAFNDVAGGVSLNDEMQLVSTGNQDWTWQGGQAEPSAATGFYIHGTVAQGEFDDSLHIAGYEYDGYNLMLGYDTSVGNRLQLGLAGSYAYTEADFNEDGGDTESTAYGITAYGSLRLLEGVFLEAIAGIDQFDADLNRNSGFGNNRGSSSGGSLGVSSGLVWNLLQTKRLRLSAFGYGHYINAEIDGFEEQGDVTAVAVDDAEMDTVLSDIGMSGALQLTPALTTEVRVGWQHNYSDEDSVSVAFVDSPNTPWDQTLTSMSTDSIKASVGVRHALGRMGSASVWLTSLTGDDAQEYGVQFRANYRF